MTPGKSWLQRQNRDPYVRAAREGHYRSRAVFKLEQIDRRDHLFRPGQTVVDLGAAPGSWSQYVHERIGPDGMLLALDILDMTPVAGVTFLRGDFTEQAVYDECMRALDGRKVDIVISDMAPNLTGIRATDQARSMYLAELVLEFARAVLRPGGDLLLKVFQGEGTDAFRKELQQAFQKVSTRKPDASRDESREFYVLARSYQI